MKQEVMINNQKISYTVKESVRAKRIRIAVYCDGTVVITSPKNTLEDTIQKYLHLKSSWIIQKLSLFSRIEVCPDIAIFSEEHFLLHKDKALNLVIEKVEGFSKKYGFDPNKLSVKKLKTKWGSCSIKKNLNFNYKVLFLSEELQNYIIVHELCHLKQMDHSKKFWRYVNDVIPEYKLIGSKLKTIGL